MLRRIPPVLLAALLVLPLSPPTYAAKGLHHYESLSDHLPARQQVVGNVSASADLGVVVLRARHWWVRADGQAPERLDLPEGAQVCDVSADGAVLLWREAGRGLDLPAMHVLDLATGHQTTVDVPDEAIATWCAVVSGGGSRVAYPIADAELPGHNDGWATGRTVVWTRATGAVEVAGPGVEEPKKPWPPVVRGISDDGRYVLYLAPSEGPRGEYRGQVVVRWDTVTGDQVRLSRYRRTAVRAVLDAAGDTVAWNDRSWSHRERVYVAEVPLDAGSDASQADVRLLADDEGAPTGVRVQALSPDGQALSYRYDFRGTAHDVLVQALGSGRVTMARSVGRKVGVPQVWAVADGGSAALMTSRERLADTDRRGRRTRDLYLWTTD